VAELTERVDLTVPPLERVILAGLRKPVRPLGELEDERVTVPVKLLTLVNVIVELDVAPTETVILEGLAEIVRSGGGVLKNSVIGVALASLDVRLGKFQLTSIVLVALYWSCRVLVTKPVLTPDPAHTA
jgi:hypothetical protein